MTLTAALCGGAFGVSCHMLNNSVRKIPLSRYPWGHVGLFIGGAYVGVWYEGFELQQLKDVNEMRADRGLPKLLGTEAFYNIDMEEKGEEPEKVEEVTRKTVLTNPLGQVNKWFNNELKTSKRLQEDNEIGQSLEYDKEDLADKKVKFTQHFFQRISEREDIDDNIRAYCKKMSTQTAGKFFDLPEGTTIEDIKAMRKTFVEKRLEKAGITDEKMAKGAAEYDARKGKPLIEINPSDYPQDMQEEMHRTGNHIKLQDYLNAKVEAFDKMSYEEQKDHIRTLFKSMKQWNAFTVEEKLHYSVPNFDDLPYEEQKKLRKNMKATETYSLPIFAGDPDAEVGNSETFKELEKIALKNKENWMQLKDL